MSVVCSVWYFTTIAAFVRLFEFVQLPAAASLPLPQLMCHKSGLLDKNLSLGSEAVSVCVAGISQQGTQKLE